MQNHSSRGSKVLRYRSGSLLLIALAASLQSCGGSSKGGTNDGFMETWTSGFYEPSSKYEAMCANPRTGLNPYTGLPYADKQGTAVTENNWLRSWTNQYYLWYDEVADINPANHSTPAYFQLMKTQEITDSGTAKDKFHFSYDTAAWLDLSISGVEAGYGIRFSILNSTPPRSVKIGMIDPNAPTEVTSAGLTRGAEILAIDGVDLINANDDASIDILNAGLSPSAVGEAHTFTVLDLGQSVSRDVVLHSASVTSTPVQNVRTISTMSGDVGYILFNDHIATAESLLVDAITSLQNSGVSDLVLDLRYNGGGYLDLASELAYMIAGPSTTSGKTFETTVFNSKYTSTNPITGEALTPTPFYSSTLGFSTTPDQALPTLNLSRVFVLTTDNTCSASEAIINGLRGVGVTVIQIGATTCGKPYGFYPEDNCGTTYFSIQFKGENQAGFGDYADGFSPQNDSTALGVSIPGCAVADDLTHELGDSSEALLSAALNYRASATCPDPSFNYSPARVSARARSALDGKPVHLSPLHQMRILRKH